MAPHEFEKYKIGIDVEADLEIKEEDAVEEEEQLSEEIEEEEEKLMEADELDQLGEEMDLPRNEGERGISVTSMK